jgi:membrane-associated phospholipid phosphatase
LGEGECARIGGVFQIEPILFLQSFASTPLTLFLSTVTLMGNGVVYVLPLLVLVFAVRLRPGLCVVGGVVLAALLTEGLKDAVAYPRPDEVDARVARSSAAKPLATPAGSGPRTFWAGPQPGAIVAVRRRAAGNYGFPSGHVSGATAFLLCTALFLRSRRTGLFAIVWVPLMALSRMYLGRHFLADVLAGVVVGLVATALAALLFRSLNAATPAQGHRRPRRAFSPITLVALALAMATPWQPLLPPRYVGGLLGLLLSVDLLRRTPLPGDGGSDHQRALRVALASIVLVAGAGVMEGLVHWAGLPQRLTRLALSIATVVATFAGTVWASVRLGWYPPPPGGLDRLSGERTGSQSV